MRTMRLASLAVAAVMLFTLSGTTVFGQAGSDPRSDAVETSELGSSARKEIKPNEKLRADVLKLVADAKAGRVAPRAQQFPQSGKNNLSTGAKIGIVAGIAGAIVVIVILHKLNSD